MRRVVDFINEYDPGMFPEDFKQEVIQLASNENPYPPPESVLNAIKSNLFKINRYPYPYYTELKTRISEYVGVDSMQIAVSNGASDLLRLVTDAIIEPFDKVYIPMPSYSMYLLFSILREANIKTEVFEGYYIDGCYERGKLAFLCNPNNPTGNCVKTKAVREYLENFDYVVVDEAYIEFSGKSTVKLLKDYENLIVVRSFSKFFGLAGMRIGYIIASESIAKVIEKIRNPFAISQLACISAIEALKNLEYYQRIARMIVEERERMKNALKKRYFVYDSDANFLLVKHEREDLVRELAEKGVLVRDVSGLDGLDGYHFRVTVGRRQENDKFLEVLNV